VDDLVPGGRADKVGRLEGRLGLDAVAAAVVDKGGRVGHLVAGGVALDKVEQVGLGVALLQALADVFAELGAPSPWWA
jgi:hypothetical protein